jgi:hypothetical protein
MRVLSSSWRNDPVVIGGHTQQGHVAALAAPVAELDPVLLLAKQLRRVAPPLDAGLPV